jgi:hypothetical protein
MNAAVFVAGFIAGILCVVGVAGLALAWWMTLEIKS